MELRRATESPRAALRAELLLVSMAAREDLGVALRIHRSAAAPWIRDARLDLAAVLVPALERLRAHRVAVVAAEADAAVRRIAGAALGDEVLPPELMRHTVSRATPPVLPDPPRRVGLLEAVSRSGGGGAVRVALVAAAAAPALGLTVAGGRLLLPLAVGLAVAVVALLAAHRRATVERDRWTAWVDAALTATSAAARADAERAVVVCEHRAAPLLDRLAAARRARITTELRALGGHDAP